MAHFEKYTLAQSYMELDHDRRGHTNKRDHIDKTKAGLNYNLADHGCDPWQFLKDKIDMSKKTGGRFNSRSVSLVSCIITLPKTYEGDPLEFFETAKEFLDMHFGAENVASAWVHNDEPESMPHLHYKVCPIIDNDKGAKQFNAKHLVNRTYLQSFHNELQDYMCGRLGFDIDILNGACTEGALTVPQLKKQQEKYDKLCAEYKSLVGSYNALVGDYKALYRQVKTLKDTIARLEKKLEQYAHIADDVLDDTPKKAKGHDDREW